MTEVAAFATLKFIPVYECSKCGAQKTGSTVRRELTAGSLRRLGALVASQLVTSSNMPTGWSYNGAFKCDGCVSKGANNEAG